MYSLNTIIILSISFFFFFGGGGGGGEVIQPYVMIFLYCQSLYPNTHYESGIKNLIHHLITHKQIINQAATDDETI